MGSQKNTITINGKIYDIASGHVMDKASVQPVQSAKRTIRTGQVHPQQHMSDIIRPTQTAASRVQPKPKPLEKTAHKPATSHASINHAKRKPAKTQTLARNYVKKPTAAKPVHVDKPNTPRVVELRKAVDHNRLHRAQKVQRSRIVSKFGHSDIRPVAKKVDHIAVVPEPKAHKHQTANYDINNTPPVRKAHHKTATRQSKDLFASALSASNSHHQTYAPKKSQHKKNRWPSIVAGSLTGVLLIAFFVYQNIPSIALYTTSSKVGFNVTKPSYQPAGYGLKGPLQYNQGKVVLDFRSNSDDKSYTIEQTKTELDSASLMNDYLTKQGKNFSTEFANGRTVYIYGNNNATWVDGGVWYNLSNQANLTNDQLLKIVSSI